MPGHKLITIERGSHVLPLLVYSHNNQPIHELNRLAIKCKFRCQEAPDLSCKIMASGNRMHRAAIRVVGRDAFNHALTLLHFIIPAFDMRGAVRDLHF